MHQVVLQDWVEWIGRATAVPGAVTAYCCNPYGEFLLQLVMAYSCKMEKAAATVS